MMKAERNNLALGLAFTVAAAAGAGAVWLAGEWGAGASLPAQAPAHAAPGPAQRGGNWLAPLDGRSGAAARRTADPLPLAEQVDALIATRHPEDAYKAHNLISECMTFQQFGVVPFFHFPEQREMSDAEIKAEARLCATLTEQLKRSRIDYLATAAKAGVAGASSRFLMAGPFGDPSALETRPDDPLVVEWKQQAMEMLRREADAGDLSSLNTLWTGHMGGMSGIPKSPLLAYTYHAAMEAIFKQQNPGASDGWPYQADMFAFLKDGLTPEQLARADQEAARIAANFQARLEADKQAGAPKTQR